MGGWKVENDQIVSGNLAATQMACEANAMAQEGVAANLFSNRKAPFTLDMSNPDQPKLTIVATNGEKVEFTGTMTPETKYQSEGETLFLEVSPETKQCTGVAPQTCLQVKEIKYAENGVKTYRWNSQSGDNTMKIMVPASLQYRITIEYYEPCGPYWTGSNPYGRGKWYSEQTIFYQSTIAITQWAFLIKENC